MFPGLLAQAAEALADDGTSIIEWLSGGLQDTVAWVRYVVESAMQPGGRLIVAAILGTLGLRLLMPGRQKAYSRVLGATLGGLAGVCLLSLVPPVTLTVSSAMFTVLASLTVAAAVATVTSKSPIYSAVWFAATLLGVGGLLLVNGAQFVGIATIAVYAGAIVVTLLFVLMLAQPVGSTHYDRISWGRTAQWLGCAAGAISACLLVWALLATPVEDTPTAANPVLAEDHVAILGGELFSRHLVAVEIAGLLLFAALVGCVAIAGSASRRGMTQQVESALATDSHLPTGDILHE